jgi:negative regulator of flagellin synthesis FlgM
MMISKTQVQNILKAYAGNLKTGNVNKSNEVKQKFSRPDELAISGESKIKQRAMQAVKQAEDIRPDLVNELQDQISAGSYERSDDEVAEKMISRAIVDKMV